MPPVSNLFFHGVDARSSKCSETIIKRAMKEARKDDLMRRQEAMMMMENPAFALNDGGGAGEGLHNVMLSESMRDFSLLQSMSLRHRYSPPPNSAAPAVSGLQPSYPQTGVSRAVNLAAISEGGIGEGSSAHGGRQVDEPMA